MDLTALDPSLLLEQPMGSIEGTQVNARIGITTPFENTFRSSLVDLTNVSEESAEKKFLGRIQELASFA